MKGGEKNINMKSRNYVNMCRLVEVLKSIPKLTDITLDGIYPPKLRAFSKQFYLINLGGLSH